MNPLGGMHNDLLSRNANLGYFVYIIKKSHSGFSYIYREQIGYESVELSGRTVTQETYFQAAIGIDTEKSLYVVDLDLYEKINLASMAIAFFADLFELTTKA